MSDTPDRVKRFFEQRKRAEEGTWTMPESMAPGSTSRAGDLPQPSSSELQQVPLGPQILSDRVTNCAASVPATSAKPPSQYPASAHSFSRPEPVVGTLINRADMYSAGPKRADLAWLLWTVGILATLFSGASYKALRLKSIPVAAVLACIAMGLWVTEVCLLAYEGDKLKSEVDDKEGGEQESMPHDT